MKSESPPRIYSPQGPASEFREVRGRISLVAFLIGMAIVLGPVFLGRSYAFYITVLVFSIFLTILWRKNPRPWIVLVMTLTATPIPLFRQQIAANLVFALWFIVLNIRSVLKLPKWIYVPCGLALIGVVTSSINWMSPNVIGSMMRQGAFAYNFVLAPFLLLPLIYAQMAKSRDSAANLKGLLFCLIFPSTLILCLAKWVGTPANLWEASLHAGSGSEGYVNYVLGKAYIHFARTQVGFILAALICASTAVTVSRIKTVYRLTAGACLLSNSALLLSTGSFGSAFACLCGLAAIFFAQFRTVNVARVLVSMIVIVCMLFLTYFLSPPSIKEYLGKRYEHRIEKADKDRILLWSLAFEHLVRHPGGVGLTLSVGHRQDIPMHNDYLTYAVSYGIFGGLAYISLVAGLVLFFCRVRKNGINDPCALAIHFAGLGVLVAMAVNSVTDQNTANRWYFNLIWSLIWYSYFCSRSASSEKRMKGEPVIEGR